MINRNSNASLIVMLVMLLIFGFIACQDDEGFGIDVEIPNFNFPKTVVFKDSLSMYSIFEGSPSDLIPAEDFQLLELSSILFTDYAHKQRLDMKHHSIKQEL